MKYLKVLSLFLVAILFVTACQDSPLAAPEEDILPEEMGGVVYDADFAHEVCGENLVIFFDPSSGEVECAEPQPLLEEEVEGVTGEPFQTPVEATDVFNEESSWLIAEPGVILDDTAAWVIPSVKAEHYVNIPEGGFTYFSLGGGIITADGVSLVLPGAKGLNYLVLVRGRIDDTIVDSDLNLTATVVDFVPGHAIWSIMPPGAYVSKGWFNQQLVTSTTTGGTNCGATGCTTVHVVLFDVDSHFYQKFEVKADNLDSWTLLKSN